MVISSTEKTKIFNERNNLLRKANEFLKQQNFLDAAIALEDAMVLSTLLGETERASGYFEKLGECLGKIDVIDRDLEMDSDFKADFLKEKRGLINLAQEAAQTESFREAISHYRKAIVIAIQLKDKISVWKLSKKIVLLAQKLPPTEIILTCSPGETISECKPEPVLALPKKASTQPIKKDMPFFRAVIEEKGKEKSKKKEPKSQIEKRTEEKVDKKEKKSKKKPEKRDLIVEKPVKRKSALPEDVLSEIRSFQHDDLESKGAPIKEKKKVSMGRSLLPADVLEELKKKAESKNSDD